MRNLSSELLSMTDEPAALFQNRRLVYLNAAAQSLLGVECAGQSLRELFGSEVAEAQSPSFLAAVPVAGQRQLLRISRLDEQQVVFFTRRDTNDELLNDALMHALRSSLMNLDLALRAGRRLAEDSRNPELHGCFAALNREYYLLNRLLSNLDAARGILRGDLALCFNAVNLGTLASELMDSLNLLRPDLRFYFSIDRKTLVWADAARLELALLNLLSNCLSHAKGAQNVRLEISNSAEYVYLTVRDDGAGIPPELMATLFCRYRAEASLHQLSAGVGLGLTVVRGTAEAHGGTMMIESREGHGTQVRFSLARDIELEKTLDEAKCCFASSMQRLLTGLAPALDKRCFQSEYLD